MRLFIGFVIAACAVALISQLNATAAPPSERGEARFQLVGYTTATFVGTHGPLGYSRACHAEFSESRWCTDGEVLDSSNPLSPPASAWVRAKLVAPAVYESGLDFGGLSNATCGRWTNPGISGLVLTTDFSTTGTFLLQSCAVARPVACCAFLP